MRRTIRDVLIALTAIVAVVACSEDGTGGSGVGGSSATPTSSSSSGGGTADCTSGTNVERSACAANAFLATLSDTERAAVNLEYSDATSRTKWSNLPTGMKPRAGATFGALSSAAQEAGLALLKIVLSDSGYADLEGVRAADSYLAQSASGYGAELYYMSVFGTPSATDDWALMITGHHMAFIISYVGGVAYPFPNHLAVEPKAEFEQGGATYEPMADEADAILSVFGSLSQAQLASAYLDGQSFNDVLVGPVEYGTGSYAAVSSKFPAGANRTGLLVSEMDENQKALVADAIQSWVGDFNAEISDSLMAAYTSEEAFADTYVAFSGSSATGVDVDAQGTYMRIDGPRVWIEVSCQGGIVFRDATHYHSIYRDKQLDYGGSL